MDAGNWTGLNVVGEVAEHNPIHQKGSQVLGEDELQSALNALRRINSVNENCSNDIRWFWGWSPVLKTTTAEPKRGVTKSTWVVIHAAVAPWAPAPHAAVPAFFSLWTEGQRPPHTCGSQGTLTHSNKADGVTQGQQDDVNLWRKLWNVCLHNNHWSTRRCFIHLFIHSLIYTREAHWRCDVKPELSRKEEEWWKCLLTCQNVLSERGASEWQNETMQTAASR